MVWGVLVVSVWMPDSPCRHTGSETQSWDAGGNAVRWPEPWESLGPCQGRGSDTKAAALDSWLIPLQDLTKWLTSNKLRCSLKNCNIIKGCQEGCGKWAESDVPLLAHFRALGVLALGYQVWFDLQAAHRDRDIKKSGVWQWCITG